MISYAELPGWPIVTIRGHAGRLVISSCEGSAIIVNQGRIHFYEGYTMQQVSLPVRVMQKLGIIVLIMTSAAGAIIPDYSAGDIMLMTDNLNIAGMADLYPLIGPNLDEFGPSFPHMSQIFDRKLRNFTRQEALDNQITLQEGIYAGLIGTSFETPADLGFLRIAGADAVSMSTTSEVIVARYGGFIVLGFSGISNKTNLDGMTLATHEEVLQADRFLEPKLKKMVFGILKGPLVD